MSENDSRKASERAAVEAVLAKGREREIDTIAFAHFATILSQWVTDYDKVGQAFARRLRTLTSDKTVERLVDARGDYSDVDLATLSLDWVREHLPRCFELVPSKHRAAFASGMVSALHKGEV